MRNDLISEESQKASEITLIKDMQNTCTAYKQRKAGQWLVRCTFLPCANKVDT